MARAHSISSADLLSAPATSGAAALPIASLHMSHQVQPAVEVTPRHWRHATSVESMLV